MISWIFAGLLTAGYPLFFWWHTRRLRTVFMRGTKVIAGEHAQLRVQLDEAREKAQRYFDKISEFEKERDSWHNLHVRETIGHGNAQNLMMQTIEQMSRVMSARKISFKIPRVLEEVRAEFQGNYETAARADLGQMVAESRKQLDAP